MKPEATGAVTISVAGPAGVGKSALLAALGGLPQADYGGTLTLLEQSPNIAVQDSRPMALVWISDARRWRDDPDGETVSLRAVLADFRSARGRRTDIAGFPVFVAVNHCDRLALAETAALETSITRRLGDLADASGGAPAFGDLAVRVMPVSCGSEPAGVAELFAAAIPAARQYQRRKDESRSRLNWTTLGAAMVVALLVCFGAALVVSRSPFFVSALALKVEEYRATEGIGAAARLQEPLQSKADVLAGFLADQQFPTLSASAQAFVRNRLLEIDAYRDFQRRIKSCPRPTESRDEDQLAEIDRCLNDNTSPYAVEWANTDAEVLRRKRLADVAAIRAGIHTSDDWYRKQTVLARQLLDMKGPGGTALGWPAWHSAAAAFLAESPPFRPGDPLPQTESLPADKAPTYAIPLSYARVAQARSDFEKVKARLLSLVTMAQALGCFPSAGRPAPLALTEAFAVTEAPRVIDELKSLDPQWSDWSPSRFSDQAFAALKPRLEDCRNRLIEAGRRELARSLAPIARQAVVSPAQWRAAGDALASSAELRPWRELLATITKWADPHAANPVDVLIEFLRREQFDIDLRGVRLTMPDTIQGRAWKPAGPLTISIQRASKLVETVTLRPGNSNAGTTEYALVSDGPAAIIVRPGDSIWAEIMVRDANGAEMALTWWANGVRTAAYQFDRFSLPPRFHRSDQKPEDGELASAVSVEFVPSGAWPRLPDLLPALR